MVQIKKIARRSTGIYQLGKVTIKNIKKLWNFPSKFDPTPRPHLWKKNIFFNVFIVFIVTQFVENFKEKIIFFFFKDVNTKYFEPGNQFSG